MSMVVNKLLQNTPNVIHEVNVVDNLVDATGNRLTNVAMNPIQGQITTDANVATGYGQAWNELEYYLNIVRQPLIEETTYIRDIPIDRGGGWADTVSASTKSGPRVSGGVEGTLHADASNTPPLVQVDISKDIWKTHNFSVALRLKWIDLQKIRELRYNLPDILRNDVRLVYDQHFDRSAYLGFATNNTTGLLNNPDIQVINLPTNAGGTSTQWVDKTDDEVIADFNYMFAQAFYRTGRTIWPNTLLLDWTTFINFTGRRLTNREITLAQYLARNNAVTQITGRPVRIFAVPYLEGLGTGGTNRAVVYNRDRRFLRKQEMVPLMQAMSRVAHVSEIAYDTIYMAKMSETIILYPQTITYFDGI